MSRLKPLPNSELSGYAIQLLHRQRIYTVPEFLQQSNEKLADYLNLNSDQVQVIRDKLHLLYGPIQMTLFDVIQQDNVWRGWTTDAGWGCGIKALDQLLQTESLQTGSVWEICGCSGVGKTQMCLTIAVNYLLKQRKVQEVEEMEVAEVVVEEPSSNTIEDPSLPLHFQSTKEILYIDTKLDFNAHRIVSMLQARIDEIPKHIHGHLLHSIKIEHCFTLQSIKITLEKLLETFITHNVDYQQSTKNINLIIIDSISAVWFQYRSDIHDHVRVGHWLLLRINHLVHQLAEQYGLAIIFVNLALSSMNTRSRGHWNVADSKAMTTMRLEHDDEIDLNDSCSQRWLQTSGSHALRPCLGRYWFSVPNIRLSLNYYNTEEPGNNSSTQQQQQHRNSPVRQIILLKSNTLATGQTCQVQLTAKGVI